MNETQAHFVFSVERVQLGLPVGAVERVAELQTPVPIPRTPPHILGFILLGERAVVALDLRALLGLDARARDERREEGAPERVLVVRAHDMQVGLVCDRAHGVLETPANALRPAEALHGARLREFLLGEVETEQRLVGVLDLDKLLVAARLPAQGAG